MPSLPEQESPSTEYLCDYVYIDAVRLSYYYAQLSQNGLVTQSKHISKETSRRHDDVKVNVAVLGGSMNSETGAEESRELQIDSAFSRPQETLDALDEAGFIRRGLVGARMGHLVLCRGTISLFDIRMLKDIWKDIGEMHARNQTAHIQNPGNRQKEMSRLKKQYDEIFNIVSKLPHSIQGTLQDDGNAGWFTLKPECMLVSPEDLTFKHGSDLRGEWHLLAIVDALPDEPEDLTSDPSASTDLENAMRQMLMGIRTAFGRPPQRWGLTPIMIFRTLTPTDA
jgi:hypothetical protein